MLDISLEKESQELYEHYGK